MEAAPEQKIIQPVDQHDVNLTEAIIGATQPDAQKPIPLTEELEQIGVDAIHVAGSTFDELMSGDEGGKTRDRVARINPISLVRERLKRIKDGPVLKKAA